MEPSDNPPNFSDVNIFFWRRQDLRVGDLFEGRISWCADPTSGAPKPAFYPMQPDGKLNFEIPLSWVEAHPDDLDNNEGWYVVADFADLPSFEQLPRPNVLLSTVSEVEA